MVDFWKGRDFVPGFSVTRGLPHIVFFAVRITIGMQTSVHAERCIGLHSGQLIDFKLFWRNLGQIAPLEFTDYGSAWNHRLPLTAWSSPHSLNLKFPYLSMFVFSEKNTDFYRSLESKCKCPNAKHFFEIPHTCKN